MPQVGQGMEPGCGDHVQGACATRKRDQMNIMLAAGSEIVLSLNKRKTTQVGHAWRRAINPSIHFTPFGDWDSYPLVENAERSRARAFFVVRWTNFLLQASRCK